MRVAVFSTKEYDRRFLSAAAQEPGHELVFYDAHLSDLTVRLAEGFPAISTFVNDSISRGVIEQLLGGGTKLAALRCAGYNQVDCAAARELGLRVVHVPAYSPHAVAEHTVGLMLALSRRLHRAYNRVREGNFALEGLLGLEFHGRTVGVIGTGKIGQIVARILRCGFGCEVLAYDLIPNAELTGMGCRYATLDEIYAASDIISIHCPLVPQTAHLINAESIARMKPGAMLVNTSRGAIIDTKAVIDGLKSGQIGDLALDVYEEEADLFFEDLSNQVIRDDVFARLLTFPNVIITGHQAFFTSTALRSIAETTLASITAFDRGETLINEVKAAAR